MADLAFDTLSYARRMEQAGFTRQQAEAMAEEQARLIDERLATKADIAHVQADIAHVQADIARVRADIEMQGQSTKLQIETLRQSTKLEMELIRRDMEVLRRDLTIRLGGIVVASVAAGSTIVTVLSRFPVAHP